jgi:hypothetical protein
MPNLPLILVIAGVGILALYFLTGGRRGNQRRGTDLPESDLVIRPGDGGIGFGFSRRTEYHTELLIQPRGRRRVVRAIKPRGDRDRTLEGDEPADPA